MAEIAPPPGDYLVRTDGVVHAGTHLLVDFWDASHLDDVAVAEAAVDGGAEALVLTNTLAGMVIDIDERRPALGGLSGGVSGAALHPVAVRAVYDVCEALPEVPIVGVGGVARGADAVEMLQAGASAVQVGTAIFADPRAPWRVLAELREWCRQAGAQRMDDLIGAAHG